MAHSVDMSVAVHVDQHLGVTTEALDVFGSDETVLIGGDVEQL
jgi:hypothetical protein